MTAPVYYRAPNGGGYSGQPGPGWKWVARSPASRPVKMSAKSLSAQTVLLLESASWATASNRVVTAVRGRAFGSVLASLGRPTWAWDLHRVGGANSGGEAFDFVALLNASVLTAKDCRMVFDVIVNGTIEEAIADRESVPELFELAAGRISGDEYRQRIIARYTSLK